MEIRVEFFGIPRARAGVAETVCNAPAGRLSAGELLTQLADRFPDLAAACFEGDRLAAQYAMNIDGEQFVDDPQTTLRAGQAVLIMSADAGG